MTRKSTKKTSLSNSTKAISNPPRKPKAEFPYAIIQYAAYNSVLYSLDAANGTTATLTLPARSTQVKLHWAIKEQNEPVFPVIEVADGNDSVPISWQWVSTCTGKTVLIWYEALVRGIKEKSLVLELEIQAPREQDLIGSRPLFEHVELEWGTSWLDMHKFPGDEVIKVAAWPMIQAYDTLFLVIAGDQHRTPYSFFWSAYNYVVKEAEAHARHVFEFELSRHWLSQRQDYSALTAHLGVIRDRSAPIDPAPGDPHLENPLPINAQDFHLRTTTLLRVDPYPGRDLPEPIVPEAPDGKLDFTELCCGDAHLIVAPWLEIAVTQQIALVCIGTSIAGSSIVVPLLPERPVTPDEVNNGLEIAISNAALAELRTGSDISLELSVKFPDEDPTPFSPVEVRLWKSQEVFEGFDGQPNRFLAAGESLKTSTMTIKMIQAGQTPGGILTFASVPPYLTGPAIVICYDHDGSSVPPQVTELSFNIACKCLRFAYTYFDGLATLTFFDQHGAILETRALNSESGGRHRWVEFKAEKGKLLGKIRVECGDHGYLDNFHMCCPATN
ncbi:hypothetical protein [Pseudomonas azotoformans]|jgi:hypothetical protein